MNWDVEVVLRDINSDEEYDQFSMPYKSDKFEDLLRRANTWFPLAEGRQAFLLVRHIPTGKEAKGTVRVGNNKMQLWINVDGERMRPLDAVRLMMGRLSPRQNELVEVDKPRRRS